MSETTVFGCDWCKEIVPKNSWDAPRYAATVSIAEGATIDGGHHGDGVTKRESICRNCRKALQALREGKFRRG